MTVEEITRAIQLILAPVVMITSCAILVGGMLTHYAAINDRLRSLARERLTLLQGTEGTLSVVSVAGDAFKTERLLEIDKQLPSLLRRHMLVHHGVVATYGAIAVFVVSMFVIAFAVASQSASLATAALVLFLIGTAVLLAGLVFIVVEVRSSNDAVQYEVRRVMSLGK